MWHKKNRQLLLAYPADMPIAGKCLSEAYRYLKIKTMCIQYTGRPPEKNFYTNILTGDIDAVLVVGKKAYAPSTVLPGPFLFAAARKIPAAWLPIQKEEDVYLFIQTLKKVHRRKRTVPGMALLAQWHPQYLKLTQRMSDLMRHQIPVYKWTGDIIAREGVVEALGSGLGLGI